MKGAQYSGEGIRKGYLFHQNGTVYKRVRVRTSGRVFMYETLMSASPRVGALIESTILPVAEGNQFNSTLPRFHFLHSVEHIIHVVVFHILIDLAHARVAMKLKVRLCTA